MGANSLREDLYVKYFVDRLDLPTLEYAFYTIMHLETCFRCPSNPSRSTKLYS